MDEDEGASPTCGHEVGADDRLPDARRRRPTKTPASCDRRAWAACSWTGVSSPWNLTRSSGSPGLAPILDGQGAPRAAEERLEVVPTAPGQGDVLGKLLPAHAMTRGVR